MKRTLASPGRAASALALVLAAGIASLGACRGNESAVEEPVPASTVDRETPDGSPAEQAVRALLARLMEADNAGDVDAVVRCYAGDAVLLPPDGTSVAGVESIRRRYVELFASSRLDVRMSVDRFEVGESLAYARGETRGSIVPKDGSPSRRLADRYLMVLREGGGREEWRIAALAWSPLPPDEEAGR